MNEHRPWRLAFGDDAALYDRARPSYPAELIDDLMAENPRLVVDVGCGTGIGGRLLAARGCSVVGVEPDARMAAIAARHGIDVIVASFEEWQPDTKFDLVIAGQSWHWVDSVEGPMKAAAALRSGGRFAAFWNSYQHPPDIYDAFMRLYEQIAPELLAFSISLGRIRSDDPYGDDRYGRNLLATKQFADISRRSYWTTKTYTASAWVEELSTHSDHHALDSVRQQQVFDGVTEVIDAAGGEVEVTLRTGLITTTRH